MMPGILNQLGPENMASLKRLQQQFQSGGAGGDEDVPEVGALELWERHKSRHPSHTSRAGALHQTHSTARRGD
jgi:hypothetical protein